MPRSCLLVEPVKALLPRVSSAVVPPRAMSQAVAMANMYENAAVASASGLSRPTMSTEPVWREFCSVYARMTGMDALSRITVSARYSRTSCTREGALSSPSPVVMSGVRSVASG